MKLVTSRHLVRIRLDRRQDIVYHSLFGRPVTIPRTLSDLLERFRKGASVASALSADEIMASKSALAEFRKLMFLVPEGTDEYARLNRIYSSRRKEFHPQMASGKLIHKLRLEMTSSCNFRCHYCFAHQMYDSANKKLMSFETAQRAVDGYLRVLRRNRRKTGYITFWGGEPMLNWDVIRRTVEYAERVNRGSGRVLELGVVTNGALINDGIARIMKEHAMRATVSLDGLGEDNDCFRQYADGRGTFRDIIRGMDALYKHDIAISVEITLHERNFYNVEKLISFLYEKYNICLFIVTPVYHQRSRSAIDRHSARDKARRMVEIYKFGIERNIRINIEDIGLVNSAQDGKPRLFVCAGKFSTIYVKPDGLLWPCQKLAVPIGDVGRIDEIAGDENYRRTASRGVDRIPACRGCEIEGFCAGGCAGLVRFYSGDIYDTSDKHYQKFHCDYKRHLFRETLKYLSGDQAPARSSS